MLKLSKRMPARTKKMRFRWVVPEFHRMDMRYRQIRAKSKNPMDTCAWCGHKFGDGEMMGLAQPEKGRDKVLCQSCIGELEGEPD